MAKENTIIVATIEKVDPLYGATARAKTKNGEPFEDEYAWAVPKELGGQINDDVVITLTPDMSRFLSYRLSHQNRGIKA